LKLSSIEPNLWLGGGRFRPAGRQLAIAAICVLLPHSLPISSSRWRRITFHNTGSLSMNWNRSLGHFIIQVENIRTRLCNHKRQLHKILLGSGNCRTQASGIFSSLSTFHWQGGSLPTPKPQSKNTCNSVITQVPHKSLHFHAHQPRSGFAFVTTQNLYLKKNWRTYILRMPSASHRGRQGFKPGYGHVGFCDGQKWRWGRFSPRTSVSPINLHSICFSTIIFIITRGWHNRPGVAAVPIASQTK
jgi:hypothetical protein